MQICSSGSFFVTCFNFCWKSDCCTAVLHTHHLSFCNVAIIACSSMLYCSVEVLHASPALSPCLLVASFVLPWHRPLFFFLVRTSPLIEVVMLADCLTFIIGFWLDFVLFCHVSAIQASLTALAAPSLRYLSTLPRGFPPLLPLRTASISHSFSCSSTLLATEIRAACLMV